MGTPRSPGEIAKTMQLQGMNTRQILEILNNTNPELVESVRSKNNDAAKMVDKFTAAFSRLGDISAKLNTDSTLNKLTKLEQYSQSVIKLVADNKQTTTIGTQMQTELAQLPQSVNFSVARDKLQKEIKELVTKLNVSITDIMTQLQSGNMTRDQIQQGLENLKEFTSKIAASKTQSKNMFNAEQDAVIKYSALAQRAKTVVDTTPALSALSALSSGMGSAPKLDE